MKPIFTKIIAALIITGLLVSLLPGNFGIARADDMTPPIPSSDTTASAMSVTNALPPIPVVLDPNPEMENIQIPLMDKYNPQMNAQGATFAITFVPGGQKDNWGEPCYTIPGDAKAAFTAAASIWSTVIKTRVPISIRVCWANLGDVPTLGYTGGQIPIRDFVGATQANTWYQESLANALAGVDFVSGSFDMHMTFNSSYSWYLGTDGNTPPSLIDLETVITHEIGHGLNFSGTAYYSGGKGFIGDNGYPNIYDRFVNDDAGKDLTDYTSNSTALGSVLISGNLWWNGINANSANGGSRVRLFAPSPWIGGSSYSHLDYNTFNRTANSLMTYAVSYGSSNHNPGPVTEGILKDMGWTSDSTITPVITRLNATPSNQSSLQFSVKFSKFVKNVDAADFTLCSTGLTGTPAITGITGSDMTYTVTVSTGAGSGSLRLDIQAGSDIIGTDNTPLISLPYTSGQEYTIDRTAPTILSINRVNPSPSISALVNYTVTFSEAVSNVDTADFSLNFAGTGSAPTLNTVTGGGSLYNVAINTGSGSGTLRLDVNTANISDLLGNQLANLPYTSGQTYAIDRTPPVVSSITRRSTNPSTASSLGFTVTFSESVTGVDKADFALTKSGITGTPAISNVTGSGTVYIVTVSTGAGAGTLRLDLKDNDTIKDALSNYLGGKGLNNGNFTGGEKYTLDRNNAFASTGSQDGWVLESSETSEMGGSFKTSGNLQVGDDAARKQYRSLTSFNTAALPDNANIISVTFKIKKLSYTGSDPFQWATNPLLADIAKGYFGTSSLQAADFQSAATKAGLGPFILVSGYYQITLLPEDFAKINLTGFTQFRLRFAQDDNNNATADYASFYSGETATPANRPTLIVEYIIP